jgi:hypothetical protein
VHTRAHRHTDHIVHLRRKPFVMGISDCSPCRFLHDSSRLPLASRHVRVADGAHPLTQVSNACDKWELLQRVESGEATLYDRTAAANQALTRPGVTATVVHLLSEVTRRALLCDDTTLASVVDRY